VFADVEGLIDVDDWWLELGVKLETVVFDDTGEDVELGNVDFIDVDDTDIVSDFEELVNADVGLSEAEVFVRALDELVDLTADFEELLDERGDFDELLDIVGSFDEYEVVLGTFEELQLLVVR
jgi:hypothetical protein